MNTTERRKKSDAEKIKAGEARVTTWITKDANKALKALKKRTGQNTRDVVSEALIEAATSADDGK